MMRGKRISPRKEPVQQRSTALRQSIIEAATYVLKREGPSQFTTNRVTEKAGVNIASFYQYYPNKESLLFHLIELQWAKTYRAVYPILKDESLSGRARLHLFIRKFFENEAKDRDLKDAMAHLGFLVENTKEYRELLTIGRAEFAEFLFNQNKNLSNRECELDAEFFLHTITSFSECKTSSPWINIERDSRMMAAMIQAAIKK